MAQTSHYTLSLEGDRFAVRGGGQIEYVPLQEAPPKAPTIMVYRKDQSFAVWDQRGLTVRHGSVAKSYKFPDFPLNAQFFSTDEIEKTRSEVAHGKLHLEADSLSGSRRLGQRVFFLLRWTDSAQQPWLEALVQIDLDDRDLQPKVIGRFEGLTGAKGSIDDRLFLQSGSIAAVTSRATDWGVASYSFSGRNFDFVSLGEKLIKWYPSGIYLEQTAYQSKVGGQLSLGNFRTTQLFEDRGDATWLDGNLPPVALVNRAGQQIVRDCDSGQEQPFSSNAEIRRTPYGILAWSPKTDPQHAVLLSYERWGHLAAWNRGGSSTSATPKVHRRRKRPPVKSTPN